MLWPEQKKQECCGCEACSHVCPAGAVIMETDRRGFCYPEVREELCTHCGLCRQVCPVGNADKLLPDPGEKTRYLAARHVLQEKRLASSSGGVFPALSGAVLACGGVVYGAVYAEDFTVEHRRAGQEAEAEAFCTSKYVQSRMSGIYDQLGKDLEAGRPVLFSGTPCQTAAVRAFVKLKKEPEDLLITCDHICHGVPSPMIWKAYLDCLRRKLEPGDRITRINMRSKEASLSGMPLRVRTEQGNMDAVTGAFSYRDLYSGGCITRDSCYHCPFASYARCSDLTMGDFWNSRAAGISLPTREGISELLVHTQKGRKLLEDCRESLELEIVSKEAVWQPHLAYSVTEPKNREAFWQEYLDSPDPEPVLMKYMKGTLSTRLIRRTLPVLQKTGLYEKAGQLYGRFIR